MNLPAHVIYDRSTQELEDMVIQFITERSIPSNVMELMLYKVLNRVQVLKDYDIANLRIQEEEINEQHKNKGKEGVENG